MTVETIAVKHLCRKWGATLLLVTGVALSVAITVSLWSLTGALKGEIGDAFDEIGPNLLVRPAGVGESVSYAGVAVPGPAHDGALSAEDYISINSIENKKNIAAVAPKILQSASYRGRDFVLAGVYFQFERLIKKWWKFDGVWPFKEDEILLGARLSEKIGAGVGETIEIAGKVFRVTAVLEPQHTEEDEMAFANILTVQELFDRPGEISFIEVAAYCTTCPLPTIAAQISEKLPNAEVFTMQDVVLAREETVDRFTKYAVAISGVVLLIVAFVVSLLMMSSVNERTGEIGMLRSAGYRRSHIVEAILTEASIVGVAGGVIGYLLGMALSMLLAPRFDLAASDIAWDPFFGSLVLLGATVLGILAGIVPAISASKTDPVVAINHL